MEVSDEDYNWALQGYQNSNRQKLPTVHTHRPKTSYPRNPCLREFKNDREHLKRSLKLLENSPSKDPEADVFGKYRIVPSQSQYCLTENRRSRRESMARLVPKENLLQPDELVRRDIKRRKEAKEI